MILAWQLAQLGVVISLMVDSPEQVDVAEAFIAEVALYGLTIILLLIC